MMYKLPKIPYTMDKDQSAEIPFRGINYSDRLSAGDLADSHGISLRRWPLVTNKRGRDQVDEGLAFVTVHDGRKIKYIKGGAIMCGEATLAESWDGEQKRFANVNSKTVIMPDKKYIEFDVTNPRLCELEAGSWLDETTFGTNYIQGAYSSVVRGFGGQFMADENKFIVPTKKKIACNVPMLLSGAQIKPANLEDPIIVNGLEFSTVEEDSFNAKIIFGGDVPNIIFGTEKVDIIIKKADGATLSISVSDGHFTTQSLKPKLNAFCFKTDTKLDKYSGRFEVYLGEKESNFDFTQLLKAGDSASCYGHNFSSYFTVKEIDASSIEITKEFDEDCIIINCQISVHNVWRKESLEALKTGDTIRFKGSDYNTTDFVVESVNENTIYLKKEIEGETTVLVNEDIPNTKEIQILRADDTESFPDFKVGDTVTISGCGEELDDNNRTFTIQNIVGNTLYGTENVFVAGVEQGMVTITRKVPELDFICEAENRLWGCNNTENVIYISALGDPTNMYTYEGLTTDSFATAVGSPGDFTGCCRYGSSVLFFKEDKIHKILGTCPADYTLYSYDVEGIQVGSDRSAVVINEVLYYKGTHGIYAYDGGVPTLISECFGERIFYDAVAGTDGVSYYVSMRDERYVWYLFSYNTTTGIWTLEDKGFEAKDAMRVGMELYFLDKDGQLWKENAVSDVSRSEWMMQFAPLYETMNGKKTYSRLLLRAEIPKGSYMVIEIRCDGGRWMELGKIVGKSDGVVPIRIPVNRCDKFEIKLRGKGEFVLRSMLREFYVSEEP